MRELIQSFNKSIKVFRDEEKKRNYELLKFPQFKQIYIDTFAEMHIEILEELTQLPDPYFKELIEIELETRKEQADLVRTYGRFHRKEGRVCLI